LNIVTVESFMSATSLAPSITRPTRGVVQPVSGLTFAFVPVAVVAGVLADVFAAWLRPFDLQPDAIRVFPFVVPSATFALYFVALALSGGIGWSVHLWTGSIVIAGVIGQLLSYVAVPPAMPATSVLDGARP
jgi:hypothetical protein